MTAMNIQEILGHLPHRYPFILIDKVLEIHPGERLIAVKNVSINEPYFAGHFPERPIMPGVLMLEALAQASTILAFASENKDKADNNSIYLFAGIDNARFKRVVEPGDQLRLDVKLLWEKRGIWKIDANAYVGDEVACSAELMSAKKDML